jgi:hypothetical protein
MSSMGCAGVLLHAFVLMGVIRVKGVCSDGGTLSCRLFVCCGCAGVRGHVRAVRQAVRAAQRATRRESRLARRRALTIAV